MMDGEEVSSSSASMSETLRVGDGVHTQSELAGEAAAAARGPGILANTDPNPR
jgi:hypothetical protein